MEAEIPNDEIVNRTRKDDSSTESLDTTMPDGLGAALTGVKRATKGINDNKGVEEGTPQQRVRDDEPFAALAILPRDWGGKLRETQPTSLPMGTKKGEKREEDAIASNN